MELPRDLFPEKDDQHALLHLYAETAVNDPSTLKFWHRCLVNYSVHRRTFVFNVEDVMTSFTVHNLVPASLLLCLQRRDFATALIEASTLQGHVSSFQYITSFILPSASTREYVYRPLLEMIDEAVLKNSSVQQPKKRIHLLDLSPTSSLRQYVIDAVTSPKNPGLCSMIASLTKDDFMLLLRFMISRGSVVLNEDNTAVKFLPLRHSTSIFTHLLGHRHPGIEDHEIAMLQIEKSIQELQVKLEQLESKRAQYISKLKVYATCEACIIDMQSISEEEVRRKYLELLVHCKKHIKQYHCALVTLEQLHQQIESSESQAIVLDSYRKATLALRESRNIRDTSGNIKEVITSESVDDAVAAFQDELEESRAIDESLARLSITDVADDELEEELRQLTLQQGGVTAEEISKEEASIFPEVPATQHVQVVENVQCEHEKVTIASKGVLFV